MPLAALSPPSVNGASVAPFVFIRSRRLNELRLPIRRLTILAVVSIFQGFGNAAKSFSSDHV